MLPGNGGVVSHNCIGILVEKNRVSAGEDEQVAIRHQMHIRIQIVSTLDQESQGRQVSVASSKMRLSISVLVPVVDAAFFSFDWCLICSMGAVSCSKSFLREVGSLDDTTPDRFVIFPLCLGCIMV